MHGAAIGPGDVQRMSTNVGILHSEFHLSKVDPVRFLQIWMIPDRVGCRRTTSKKAFLPMADPLQSA
jgi:redox-sensitive bicupin YhaK (pirin superfamily)